MKSNTLKNVIILTALTASLSLPVIAQRYHPGYKVFQPAAFMTRGDKEMISDVMSQDDRYTTFVSYLEQAKLSEITKKDQMVTVFVPTNDAFSRLSPEIKAKLANPAILAQVMKYHIMPGEITKDRIEKNQLITLDGKPITLGVDRSEQVTINRFAYIEQSDRVTNGVIVTIDQVLLPPGL